MKTKQDKQSEHVVTSFT